jgi:hypothetical protein
VPPDWRLDMDFQEHVLGQKEPDLNIIDHFNQIYKPQKQLLDLGGSYAVIDIDSSSSNNTYYKYQMLGSESASNVDEWFLSVSPTKVYVDKDWMPTTMSYNQRNSFDVRRSRHKVTGLQGICALQHFSVFFLAHSVTKLPYNSRPLP